jgi:membrane protease YdiL (CAAX protease family)
VLSKFSALLEFIFNAQPEEDFMIRWAVSSPTNFWVVLILISSIFIVPLAEEIFFRGLIYRWLRTRIPILLAMVIQAIFFSILHGFPEFKEEVESAGIRIKKLDSWEKK